MEPREGKGVRGEEGRGADRKGAGDGAWVYPACLKLIRIILET